MIEGVTGILPSSVCKINGKISPPSASGSPERLNLISLKTYPLESVRPRDTSPVPNCRNESLEDLPCFFDLRGFRGLSFYG